MKFNLKVFTSKTNGQPRINIPKKFLTKIPEKVMVEIPKGYIKTKPLRVVEGKGWRMEI